jgi:hypothetical protein
MPMPTMPAGNMILSVFGSKTPRQVHRLTISMTIRIGSMIAAALIGETTSAISGRPISAMAPPKPPFDRPTKMTAGMAAA